MARSWRVGRRLTALGDAAIRWARLPRLPRAARRRFVVAQIDGLSHHALELALARGRMPATARLLRRGELRLVRVPVGLPTSTPAFQAALMYGGPVDIPAFEYLDKRTGEYLWFPRPWASARVEAAHAAGRRGIMEGGRTYGCVFGGGAADSVLTFAHVLRPSPRWGRFGLRARLTPIVLLGWVTLKMSVVSAWQILRWAALAVRDFSLGGVVSSPKRLLMRLLISGWLRELFTLGVTADIYAGVPALYVNFVDYDVPAHALGPYHSGAIRELRWVDRSIRDIAQALRRVPELRYDLFVLSDHGQTTSVPFESVSGGVSPVDAVLAAFRPPADAGAPAPQPIPGFAYPFVAPFWPLAAVWQRHLAYLEPRSRERNAVWAAGLCVVPAGPNMNVYLTHTPERVAVSEIEARYPGGLDRLSRHPGIGLVLARDAAGPVCYHRGVVFRIPPPPGRSGCPLFDRPDRPLVVQGLQDLLAMPSAGDVVVFGHYAAGGCVSFLGERGSHAGPSEDELYGFVMAPRDAEFDFEAVTSPADLYRLFAGYREPVGRAEGA
ncbi:MAG: alkaline phosphatase family protein [Candidatus Rokuibacteriota bacterium]